MLRLIAIACFSLAVFSAQAQVSLEYEEPLRPPDRQVITNLYTADESSGLRTIVVKLVATASRSEGRDDITKLSASFTTFTQGPWSAQGATLKVENHARTGAGWDKMNLEVWNISGNTTVYALAEKGIVVSEQFALRGSIEQAPILEPEAIKKDLSMTGGSLSVITTAIPKVVANFTASGFKASDENFKSKIEASLMWKVPDKPVELAFKAEVTRNSKPSADYYSPSSYQAATVAVSSAGEHKGWQALGTVGAGAASAEAGAKPTFVFEGSIKSPKLTLSSQLNPVTLSLNFGYSYDGARDNGYTKSYAMLQASIPL